MSGKRHRTTRVSSHILFSYLAWCVCTTALAEPTMPTGLEPTFEIPADTTDPYGNPVKKGTDEKTGWPFEVRHKTTGIHFVLIPAGEFQMGSNDYVSEKPVRTVKIAKPFYLGKYEVTQGEWEKVMGLPAAPGTAQAGNNPSKFKGEKNPVDTVNWEGCQEFIRKLSSGLPTGTGAAAEGRPGPRFTLPSEAQWEYACRAGTVTRFSFGDGEGTSGEYAWDNRNSDSKTHPVGGKKPNPWGLYDMLGNVWEWCEDVWHESYSGAPTDGIAWRTGADPGGRVLRGGSWLYLAHSLRSASRTGSTADRRDNDIGFRVALELR